MDDSVQRRAIWLAALAIFAFVIGTFSFGFGAADMALWRAALFVATIAALLASIAAAGLAYVADGLPFLRRPGPERSLALSYSLLWISLLFTGIQIASAAVQSVGGNSFE